MDHNRRPNPRAGRLLRDEEDEQVVSREASTTPRDLISTGRHEFAIRLPRRLTGRWRDEGPAFSADLPYRAVARDLQRFEPLQRDGFLEGGGGGVTLPSFSRAGGFGGGITITSSNSMSRPLKEGKTSFPIESSKPGDANASGSGPKDVKGSSCSPAFPPIPTSGSASDSDESEEDESSGDNVYQPRVTAKEDAAGRSDKSTSKQLWAAPLCEPAGSGEVGGADTAPSSSRSVVSKGKTADSRRQRKRRKASDKEEDDGAGDDDKKAPPPKEGQKWTRYVHDDPRIICPFALSFSLPRGYRCCAYEHFRDWNRFKNHLPGHIDFKADRIFGTDPLRVSQWSVIEKEIEKVSSLRAKWEILFRAINPDVEEADIPSMYWDLTRYWQMMEQVTDESEISKEAREVRIALQHEVQRYRDWCDELQKEIARCTGLGQENNELWEDSAELPELRRERSRLRKENDELQGAWRENIKLREENAELRSLWQKNDKLQTAVDAFEQRTTTPPPKVCEERSIHVRPIETTSRKPILSRSFNLSQEAPSKAAPPFDDLLRGDHSLFPWLEQPWQTSENSPSPIANYDEYLSHNGMPAAAGDAMLYGDNAKFVTASRRFEQQATL